MTKPDTRDDMQPSVLELLVTAALRERFPVVRTTSTEPRAEIPHEVRRAVHMRDYWRCQWCDRYWTEVALELDHIIPWSAGGSDSIENLRTLCTDCNRRRSNFDIDTVQRRLPVAPCCSECEPEQFWETECGIETIPVFCLNCQSGSVGPEVPQ